MRQIFNCKTCKHTEVREYTLLRVETWGPGGMYERRIVSRMNEYGREVRVNDDFIPCPTCRKLMAMAVVRGTRTDHVCDARCTSAKGPNCECSCGGKNHGKDHELVGVC